MRAYFSLSYLLLFAVLALTPWLAQARSDAYSAIVPVSDTSEPQRDHAFAVGLAQVLRRTAERDLSGVSGYAQALTEAPGMVKRYRYQHAGDGGALLLRISFDRAAVRHVIDSLGALTWPSSRPPVLLLVYDADGRMLQAAELVTLTQAAGARGLDFVFADAASTPDPARLEAGEERALSQVARRFHTGLILIGQLRAGRYDWTWVAAGKPSHWQASMGSRDAMLAAAGNTLADRLNARFASVPHSVASAGTLWVSGISSAYDFARLLAMLRHNHRVLSVTPQQAQGDGLLLQISASAPLMAVLKEPLIQGRLLPLTQAHAGADASVRWVY